MTKHVLRPLVERFVEKCAAPNSGGCVLWLGALTTAGYGSIGAGRRSGGILYAHRVAWELANGPIPSGLYVCHRCDNPSCVSVHHLFLGTQRENMRDAASKGRTPGPAKLDVTKVLVIRASGEPQHVLAQRFGVTQQTISKVVTRETWKCL